MSSAVLSILASAQVAPVPPLAAPLPNSLQWNVFATSASEWSTASSLKAGRYTLVALGVVISAAAVVLIF